MTKSKLTEGSPMGVILRFTLPLLIGNVFQQFYNMVDTIIVGRFVGQNALAAVGSTGTLMFLVLGMATGLTTGFTVLTSQRFGAGDVCGTRRSVSNAFTLSIIVIAVMTFVSVAFMHPILHLMNTPDEIYEDAYRYIIVICGGLFCTIFYNLFASMLRAVGNSKMPLVFLVFSAVLNIFLDLLLIVVFHMGTRGAAVATVLSQGVSAVLEAVYVVRVPELRLNRDFYRMNRVMAHSQLTVGIPMALQFGITASGTVVLQTAINSFGAVAVAGYTAASKVQMLLTQGYVSVGQTLASYTGQNYGARRIDRIHQGVRAALKADVVYSIIVGIGSVLLLAPMMHLFFTAGTDFEAMLAYGRPYIYFCVSCFIPLGMIFIFRNAMQGCGYGFLPMMGGVVELICRMIPALLAIRLHVYLLAAACDALAWLGAGIFTCIACLHVMRRVEEGAAE